MKRGVTHEKIDILQWMEILLALVGGLHFMQSNGFVHGNLKIKNIMVRNDKARPSIFSSFFNLENAKLVDKMTHASAYRQDISMFA